MTMVRINRLSQLKASDGTKRKVISVRDALQAVEKSRLPIRSFMYRDATGSMIRITFRNGVIVMEQNA